LLPLAGDQNNSIGDVDCRANNRLHRFLILTKKQGKVLAEKPVQQIQRIFFGKKMYQLYFAVKWFRRLNKKTASINVFTAFQLQSKDRICIPQMMSNL
jgi:hypothetical protein